MQKYIAIINGNPSRKCGLRDNKRRAIIISPLYFQSAVDNYSLLVKLFLI